MGKLSQGKRFTYKIILFISLYDFAQYADNVVLRVYLEGYTSIYDSSIQRCATQREGKADIFPIFNNLMSNTCNPLHYLDILALASTN